MFLSRSPLKVRRPCVRLTCVRHAASVDPEPGSNSSKDGEAACADFTEASSQVWWPGRRQKHTSVGKVRGDKKASGLLVAADSAWCHRCSGSALSCETLSFPTEEYSTTSHERLQAVRGRSFNLILMICACARDRVVADEQEYTRPIAVWQMACQSCFLLLRLRRSARRS